MTKSQLYWPAIIFLAVYNGLLFCLLPVYFIYFGAPSTALIIATVALYIFTGMSITVGYHRLYSHLTFRTNKIIEAIITFFGTLSVTGSALRWSHDHRLHHKHVDSDQDPYNINKGFWWAHMIWFFFKRDVWDEKIIKDLLKNKLLAFQEKHYTALAFATNIPTTIFIGWLTGDYFGAFVFSFLLRLFVVHHCMFFINSLAHFYGSKPYSTEHTAVNNWFISLLTFGEGYHNFHHSFAYDYRNGVRWYQFDPSKMFIWTLHKFGLAKDLKRGDKYRIYQALIREDEKRLLKTFEKKEMAAEKRQAMVDEIKARAERLYEHTTKLTQQITEYYQLKKDKMVDKARLRELKAQIKTLKVAFKRAMNEWGAACRAHLTHNNEYALSH